MQEGLAVYWELDGGSKESVTQDNYNLFDGGFSFSMRSKPLVADAGQDTTMVSTGNEALPVICQAKTRQVPVRKCSGLDTTEKKMTSVL